MYIPFACMSDLLTEEEWLQGGFGVYRCGSCGNVLFALDGDADVTCCGSSPEPASGEEIAVKEPDLVSVLTEAFDVNETALDLCFCVIEQEVATIKQITEHVDLDRSAVSRYVNRLVDVGILEKSARNLDGGGTVHVYTHTDPEVLKERLTAAFLYWAGMGLEQIREVNDEKLEIMEQEESEAEELRMKVFWES